MEERHELRRDLVLPPLERVELRQRRVQVADELPDPGAALDDVGVGAGGRLEVRQRPLRRRDVAREVRRARGRRREDAARRQVPERRAAQELDAARGERGLARAERRRVRRRRRQAQRPVERRVPPVVLHRARVARGDAHRPRAAGGAHRRGRRLDDATPLVARDLLGPVQQRRVERPPQEFGAPLDLGRDAVGGERVRDPTVLRGEVAHARDDARARVRLRERGRGGPAARRRAGQVEHPREALRRGTVQDLRARDAGAVEGQLHSYDCRVHRRWMAFLVACYDSSLLMQAAILKRCLVNAVDFATSNP